MTSRQYTCAFSTLCFVTTSKTALNRHYAFSAPCGASFRLLHAAPDAPRSPYAQVRDATDKVPKIYVIAVRRSRLRTELHPPAEVVMSLPLH